jgi:hypothetical protein
MMVLALRTCAGTRKNGEPCCSRILLEDGYCSAHSPTRGVDMAALGRSAGLASGEARRELGKTVRERLREKVEENVDRIWSAFESGLTSDDERTQIVAATAVLAEAYGRPPQSIVGDPDRPVAFVLDSLLGRARGEV